MLQKLISGGFAVQMGAGTVEAAKQLHDNWDVLTPAQRADLITESGLSALMTAASTRHAIASEHVSLPVERESVALPTEPTTGPVTPQPGVPAIQSAPLEAKVAPPTLPPDFDFKAAETATARQPVAFRSAGELPGEYGGEAAVKTPQARLDALLEGYELHGVPLTEKLGAKTAAEIMELKGTLLGHVAQAPELMGRLVKPEHFRQLAESECSVSYASLQTQIERRRLMPKQQPSITNVYHVHGSNPRWNTNSTDNSINVIAVSHEQVFRDLRQQIASSVPAGEEQADILDRVSALEKAQNTPSFVHRYNELIAAAANHMVLIGPFIPALTEMLHKTL